ncbi:MAG: ATPase [Paenibacillus sp.]|jgi:glucosamine kinase|nr:ATPase [Paenibacillus sp.]
MADQSGDVVIGIDGGGTHTRVMVADLLGNVLSYVEKGASSIKKDLHAKQNVHQAVTEALAHANKSVRQVRSVAAGIAGYDSEAELEWVESLTDIAGLDCPKRHVNDAVVAHSGALLSKPGIVVISGTGSIIFAATENGSLIRNYDLYHYASSAARFIAYDATFEALAGNIDSTDEALVRSMLQHWDVQSLQEYAGLAKLGFVNDKRERDKHFGQMAPFITEAACQGSRLAVTVCNRAVHQIIVGIEMLASYFSEDTVAVTFIGSVANSPYFKQTLNEALRAGKKKRYKVVDPAFSAVTGSVLMALEQINAVISDELIHNLKKHPSTKH